MEEKKISKLGALGLSLLVTAFALFYVKDEAGIDSITDFLLTTASATFLCFVAAGLSAALGGAAAEKLYGEKMEISYNTIISCFLLAVVAMVFIMKADSCTPDKVANRLSLSEVLEAYDEKDEDATFDSAFYYVKENARDYYSDAELMEKMGIDVSDFVYEYMENRW